MEQFNKLTPAEAERLFYLLEELGEAQQAIGKILRHGYESSHPDILERTNRMDLERELRDVYTATSMLTRAGDLQSDQIFYLSEDIPWKYFHHQK